MEKEKRLYLAAKAAQAKAHAPYSRFKVGAAVLDEKGRIHSGCNVENAALPEGICAETAALAAMVVAGGKQAKAIGVLGSGKALVTPCGGCRQRIREFATSETVIHIFGPRGLRQSISLQELLPQSFGPAHLKAK